MEPIIVNPSANGTNSNNNNALTVAAKNNEQPTEKKAFIEANTTPVLLPDLKQRHIIPTYKDSTPLISHADFVEVANEVVHQLFAPEKIAAPQIRLSHPILGRIPEAKDKPVKELQDWDKTLYYERAAFVIEIPPFVKALVGRK